MKKIYLFTALLSVLSLVACDPVEDDYSTNIPVTVTSADQIKATVTVETQNGKNVNKVHVNADGNAFPVNLSNGVNTSYSTDADFLLFNTGTNTIYINAQNADGSIVTKELTVNVDEMYYDVPVEYSLLCGTGEKVWVWSDDVLNYEGIPEWSWGNCGYRANTGEQFVATMNERWWGCPSSDIGNQANDYGFDPADGGSATMTFVLNGLKIVKSSGKEGTFSFDMTQTTTDAGGNGLWGIGKLYTTGAGILFPCQINSGTNVTEFDIAYLSDERLVLYYASSGTGDWGEATFWSFKAQ